MGLFDTTLVNVDTGKGKTKFRVPTHWEFVKKLGSGAYGSVAAFKDINTGAKVAVKKITSAFDDEIDGKRILREVKLLRQLDHPNISQILDILPPESPDFDDIYIVTDLMDSDLHRVISTPSCQFGEEHQQFIMYQLFKGLVYLHSACIVHRDLKPANLLINKQCHVKICDFGLARVLVANYEDMTDYVVTRWYRAPELILAPSEYSEAIDNFSAGCIMFELVSRKPLFKGKDTCDQIKKILEVLGSPSKKDMEWVQDQRARSFIERFNGTKKVPWETLLPDVKQSTIEVIDALVRFDPASRSTAQEVLRFKYFEGIFDEEDVEVCAGPADFSFDDFEPTKPLLQSYIYGECASFHPEILERDHELLLARKATLAL
eukprot:TRINITY_DN1508_c0_g2_i1.p1 TRINITY_DN1508_c0_g2~~TRINITY_DN1508_c0_g2_i1.p1  ORF type:complete len:376 (+),score=100.38 TRINITY_DN1508_c0_g2_i1:64-1191(+)